MREDLAEAGTFSRRQLLFESILWQASLTPYETHAHHFRCAGIQLLLESILWHPSLPFDAPIAFHALASILWRANIFHRKAPTRYAETLLPASRRRQVRILPGAPRAPAGLRLPPLLAPPPPVAVPAPPFCRFVRGGIAATAPTPSPPPPPPPPPRPQRQGCRTRTRPTTERTTPLSPEPNRRARRRRR